MKLETQFTDDHQAILTIEVEDESFERAKRRAARAIARKTKIPGFRPGKAPYEIIVRQVGEAAVIEKAIDHLADELYPKALEEADIEPGAPGVLEEINSLSPLKLTFTVPLSPEVTLGDYQSLRLPYEYEGITDEEVDEFIETLRAQRATVITVNRPAQEGDVVHITINAERLDVEAGEDANLFTDYHTAISIEPENEADTFDWPFPDFSRLILGMAAGEEKEVEHEFEAVPESGTLKGVKKACFHIRVEKVTERELPELDDEFAQSLGEFETMDELRAELRTVFEESRRAKYEKNYSNQALDALTEQSEIKYPPAVLERELKELREDFDRRLSQQGLSLEMYLKVNEQDEEAFEAELREIARKRVRRSLVLYKLANQENIEASPDEVQEQTMRMLDELSGHMPEKEFRKLLKSQDSISNMVSSVMMDVVAEKTMRKLSEIAQGKAEEVEEAEPEPEAEEAAPESVAEEVPEPVEEQEDVAEA